MAALLALLSLLGACSGMLDLPDQPRVSTETTAPLRAQPGHAPRDGADGWREPRSWPGTIGPSPTETLGPSTADAGAANETEDGGVEVRLNSG
jgi:hypothetical protein